MTDKPSIASRRALLMGFAAAATPIAPALAGAMGGLPASPAAVDPIFEVIERHRAAHLAMHEAYHANDLDDAPDPTDPEWPWDPNKMAFDRAGATVLPLLTTIPTTLAGAVALLNHLMCPSLTMRDPADDPSILEDACGYLDERGEAAKNFLSHFARALAHIVLASAQGRQA
jgi:hypothetical protein